MYIFIPISLGLVLSSFSAPCSLASVGRRGRSPALLRCGGPAGALHVLLALRVMAAERMARIGASLVALRCSKASPLSAWRRSAGLGGGGEDLAVDDVACGVLDEQASSAASPGLRLLRRRLLPAGALVWAVFFQWGRRVPVCLGPAMLLRRPPGLPLLGLDVVDICVFGGARYVCPGCDGEQAAPWRLLGINLSRISVCLGVCGSLDAGESVESVPSILLGTCIGVRCRSCSRPLVRALTMPWRSTKGPCVWYRVCGQGWSDPSVLPSFWVTTADSWIEMHGKVFRPLCRREQESRLLCCREEGPVFGRRQGSAHKAAGLRWCFIGSRGPADGDGEIKDFIKLSLFFYLVVLVAVALDRRPIPYPSQLYLYLYRFIFA